MKLFNQEDSAGIVSKLVVVLLLVAIIVVGGGYAAKKMGWKKGGMGGDMSGWQAVFLTNGQVYFGKVDSAGKDSLTIDNIYYLQVVNKPLQRTQEGEPIGTETQQELTLIKLGNELHGPTDHMVINRDHVLLTEKLRDDSKVVAAINQYVEDQKKAAAEQK